MRRLSLTGSTTHTSSHHHLRLEVGHGERAEATRSGREGGVGGRLRGREKRMRGGGWELGIIVGGGGGGRDRRELGGLEVCVQWGVASCTISADLHNYSVYDL